MFLHSKFGVNECNLNNKRSLFMKLLFLLIISFPMFSQSILENSISIIYVDNKSFDDINSTINGDVLPIIYLNNPDFSNLVVSQKKENL